MKQSEIKTIVTETVKQLKRTKLTESNVDVAIEAQSHIENAINSIEILIKSGQKELKRDRLQLLDLLTKLSNIRN